MGSKMASFGSLTPQWELFKFVTIRLEENIEEHKYFLSIIFDLI